MPPSRQVNDLNRLTIIKYNNNYDHKHNDRILYALPSPFPPQQQQQQQTIFFFNITLLLLANELAQTSLIPDLLPRHMVGEVSQKKVTIVVLM